MPINNNNNNTVIIIITQTYAFVAVAIESRDAWSSEGLDFVLGLGQRLTDTTRAQPGDDPDILGIR